MITQAKFNQYVKDFMEDTRERILDRIIRVDAIDTGKMFREVDYDLTGGAYSFKGSFNSVEYTKYVDEGTTKITPRSFYKNVIINQANNFDRYIKDRGVNSYVTFSKNIYGELSLQISVIDKGNKASRNTWVLKIDAES